MTRLFSSITLLFALSGITAIQAQERLQLEGTEIIGNKELPRVLYIVPWKSVEKFEIEKPPISSIMDQPLTPIERASFRRTIRYHEAIHSKAERIDPATE
jgi:hypothetical protein